jgi:hypothetical protein
MGEEDFLPECIDGEIFLDDDFDVILEIGNIVLNSILGGLGNSLEIKFKYSSPVIEFVDKNNVSGKLKTSEDSWFMLIHVSFVISDTNIDGAIVIMLSSNAIPRLIDSIEKLQVSTDE